MYKFKIKNKQRVFVGNTFSNLSSEEFRSRVKLVCNLSVSSEGLILNYIQDSLKQIEFFMVESVADGDKFVFGDCKLAGRRIKSQTNSLRTALRVLYNELCALDSARDQDKKHKKI